ncbi:hypothetical protein ACFP3U_05005 [Kitasatospora misakiensis]|uniref:Uncharacterized protein n=1 Tax=Kitasatospora misakiensis TaxID=67330 RepID=A0ABW0WVM8_9ACTN
MAAGVAAEPSVAGVPMATVWAAAGGERDVDGGGEGGHRRHQVQCAERAAQVQRDGEAEVLAAVR